MSRMSNAKALEAGTAERAKLYVKDALPKSDASGQTLALPGTLQGFVQSPIAARASGYLKRWTKDIGSRVAERRAARRDRNARDRPAALAGDRGARAGGLEPRPGKSTLERWEALRKKDAVSQQELDEKRSGDVQARANLAAADANVERLRQLEGFKRVVAPFAGVITRRMVDVGDLIDAGGGAGRVLFTLWRRPTRCASMSTCPSRMRSS